MISKHTPSHTFFQGISSTGRTKLLTSLIVVLPILSLLAGAAIAAYQYGVL